MQKKRFIFDLDGTILNTWQDLASAMNAALAEKGLPVFLPENYRLWVGSGALRLAQHLLTVEVPRLWGNEGIHEAVQVRAEELVDGFMKAYATCCLEKTEPYPGILTFLRDLQAAGQELAVLTNKPDIFAQRLVTHFFPGIFRAVVGMRPEYQPKPALDLSERLLYQLGGRQELPCVMIGDSEADVRMGKNLHATSIAVSWGYRSETVLRAEKPDFLVADVDSLKQHCFALLT